jgi:hypothetical protein
MQLPTEGSKVTVTTSDCEVDWIMLEVTQLGSARFTQAIKINDDTEFFLPVGNYRFNFHYQNSSAAAVFNSLVTTPSRDDPFPDNPENGSGTAPQLEPGLTAYRVIA